MSGTTTSPTRALVLVAVLIALGAVAAGGLSVLRQRTAPMESANERAYALRQLGELLDPSEYDNDLINDFIVVQDKSLLGGAEPREIFRAFKNGEPVGAVISTVAPKGYSGAIYLLVGVYADGRVAGVRLVRHRETRGLGDQIDLDKSSWLLDFDERSIIAPPLEQWSVRRDGGDFDQFTGATVTPRAVVSAVRDALLYFDAHRDEIFAERQNGHSP